MSEDDLVLDDKEETPEPQTKVEQFMQKLRQYSTEEEAKTHLSEISETLHCAKSLGYKAIKKIKQSGGFTGQPTPKFEAREPTAKIAQGQEIPLEAEQEIRELEEEITEEGAPTEEIGGQSAAPVIVPLSADQIKDVLDIIFKRIGILLEYPEFALEPKESQALANAYLPVIQMYVPQMATNPLVWAAVCTFMVIAPRVAGILVERRKKQKPKEEPKPGPKPETPKTETQTPEQPTTPPLEPPTETPAHERPKTAPFVKNL